MKIYCEILIYTGSLMFEGKLKLNMYTGNSRATANKFKMKPLSITNNLLEMKWNPKNYSIQKKTGEKKHQQMGK